MLGGLWSIFAGNYIEESDGGSLSITQKIFAEALGREQVQKYAVQLLELGHSHAYVNQAISALRYLVADVLKMPAEQAKYIRSKKEKKLPYVLSEQEVLKILCVPDNLKHRTMLYLTYASGLRVSEVVRLRPEDLDSSCGIITVRQGKGKKDRHALLSQAAWSLVQSYMRMKKPQKWLFPGQYPGTHLHERSLQKVFTEALHRSVINKKAGIHVLRHSFATHLLEKWHRSAYYSGTARSRQPCYHRTVHPCQHQKHQTHTKPAGSNYGRGRKRENEGELRIKMKASEVVERGMK